MKQPDGLAAFMTLVERADVLLEGFRPGVAERLGFGPEACLARDPRLVYGRMTGWGQQGPMSQMAGHDLNYLALTGALTLLQRRPEGRPLDPARAARRLRRRRPDAGLQRRLRPARGAAIRRGTDHRRGDDDGVASLTTLIYSMTAQGRWVDQPR